MTVATMTVVAFASSSHTDLGDRARLVVISTGAVAAIASLGFARASLRELDSLTDALRSARVALRPELADHEATLGDLAALQRQLARLATPDREELAAITERVSQIERRLGRVQPVGSTTLPTFTTPAGEQPRLLR